MIHRILFLALGIALLLSCSTYAAEPPAAEASDLVKLAIGLFADQDKDLRALGFDQVRNEAPGEAATRAFAAELPKLSADAQVGLLSALADRGDATARPAVLKLLETKAAEPVKVAAIVALGKLGSQGDVTFLVAQLASASDKVKAAARASLTTLPGEATPPTIAAAMKSATPELRVTLIEILAARRALDTLPTLLQAAVDGDARVRTAAMLALGQLAGPEHVAAMAAGVLKAEAGAEREAAEKAVVLAAAKVEDPELRAKQMLQLLEKSNEADRLALLPTLGRLGGEKALKLIQNELASTLTPNHTAAVQALGNWPNGSVFATVLDVAQNDPCSDCRTLALTGAIRLATMTMAGPKMYA